MRLTSRRALAGIAAGLAVAGGGAGAYAATQGGGPDGGEREAVLPDVAERLGISLEELEGAFQAEAIERLEAAVAAGGISEERAAAVRERIESGAPRLGLRPHRLHGPGPRAQVIETAAAYIGIELSELLEELRDGGSLADAAEAHGKTVEGLEQALLDEAAEHIHELVTGEFPAALEPAPVPAS
jgi:hypothetical protein